MLLRLACLTATIAEYPRRSPPAKCRWSPFVPRSNSASTDAPPPLRALEQSVTDLVAAVVQDGAVRDDVGAGAVMMALHGIGAAHDRPGWRALSRRHPVAAIQAPKCGMRANSW
ncbi:SbtR family transcriptional regulator [Nonomuraea rubra]